MVELISLLAEKTHAYSTIIGLVVAASCKFIQAHYPDAPVSQFADVLNYVGLGLVTWGVAKLDHSATTNAAGIAANKAVLETVVS